MLSEVMACLQLGRGRAQVGQQTNDHPSENLADLLGQNIHREMDYLYERWPMKFFER